MFRKLSPALVVLTAAATALAAFGALACVATSGTPPPAATVSPAAAASADGGAEPGEELELTPAPSDRVRFEPAWKGLPQEGLWRNGFDVADIDGDGKRDIVTGPAREGDRLPHIFRGDGAGGWQEWAIRWPDVEFDYGAVRVADFDGDGKADLALACHFMGVRVLRGDGKGGFTPYGSGLPWRTRFTSRAIAVGDFNEDGRPDIASLLESPLSSHHEQEKVERQLRQRVWLNRGEGRFEESSTGLRNYGHGDGIEAADVDGDGHLDLMVSVNTFGVRSIVYFGDGKGGWRERDYTELEIDCYFTAPAVGDFDGDGSRDLAVPYLRLYPRRYNRARSAIGVLFGGAAAPRFERVLYRTERKFFRSVAAGDVDGNGRDDIVAGFDDSRIYVLLSDGKGGFSFEQEAGMTGPGGMAYCVRLADLDGNGKLDVVASFGEEQGALRAWLQR